MGQKNYCNRYHLILNYCYPSNSGEMSPLEVGTSSKYCVKRSSLPMSMPRGWEMTRSTLPGCLLVASVSQNQAGAGHRAVTLIRGSERE